MCQKKKVRMQRGGFLLVDGRGGERRKGGWGGREVQSDRRGAGEPQIREGREKEVGELWDEKPMGERIWMQGAYPSGIFPGITLQRSATQKTPNNICGCSRK